MMKHRTLVTLFILSLVISTSGCSNRFVSGARKLFVQPVTDSARYIANKTRDVFDRGTPGATSSGTSEQAYKDIKPVVSIEDGAGHVAEAKTKAEADQPSLEGVITPEEAAQYREELVNKPYDAIIRYNMGRLYLQQGLAEEAVYELDMATSLDPKFTNAFILLGRALRQRRQYDLAMAKFTAAAQLQPELPVIYIESGICWDQRGYHDRARESYAQALTLSPNDGHLYNNIGYSFFLEGDYTAAIKSYRTALQMNPEDRQIHNNMAMAYSMQQKWDKALHHFTEALGEAAAQNNIGHLLLRAGKVDEALAHLELAVRLKPDSVRALGNLESALRVKGRVDDAAKLHAQLVEVERSRSRPNASGEGTHTSASFTAEP